MNEPIGYFDVPDALRERVEPIFEPFKHKKSGGVFPIEFRRLLVSLCAGALASDRRACTL